MNHEENDEENNFDDQRGLDEETHERRDSISSSSSSSNESIDAFISSASSRNTQVTVSNRKEHQQQQQHHNASDDTRRSSHMFRGSVASGNDSLTDILRGALDVDNMSFLSEDDTNTCLSESSDRGHSRQNLILETYQRRKMMESAYKNRSIAEEEDDDSDNMDGSMKNQSEENRQHVARSGEKVIKKQQHDPSQSLPDDINQKEQYRPPLPTLLPLVKDVTTVRDKPSMSIAASAAKEIMEDAAAAAAAVKLAALRRASGNSSVNENDNGAYYHQQSTTNASNLPPRAVSIPSVIMSPDTPESNDGKNGNKKRLSIGKRTIQFLKSPTTMMRPTSFQRFSFNNQNRNNSTRSFCYDESALDTLKSELDYAPPAYNKRKMLDDYSNIKRSGYSSCTPAKNANKRILLNGILIVLLSFSATLFVMFLLYQNDVISVNNSTPLQTTGENVIQTTTDGLAAAVMRQNSIGIKDSTAIDLRMVDP